MTEATIVVNPQILALTDDMGKIGKLAEAALVLTATREERLVQTDIIGVISIIAEKWVNE